MIKILDIPNIGKVEADTDNMKLVFTCYNPSLSPMEYSILAGNTYSQSEAGGSVSPEVQPAVKREPLPHYITFMVTIGRYQKIATAVCRENDGLIGYKVIS
jgi:hypothetical protein